MAAALSQNLLFGFMAITSEPLQLRM